MRKSTKNIRYRIALLGICGFVPLAWASPAAADFTVLPRQVDERKAVFATVESRHQTLARTRIGGTITELSVGEGAQVAPGQKIALVVDPKLPLRMNAIEARMRALSAQRELSRTELDRTQELRRKGTASQARLEQAQAAYDSVSGEISALQAERSVVAQQLKEGEVLTPELGRILKVHVTAGSVVQPGETVATLATAGQGFVLRMYLPERHARYLRQGDKVLVGERGLGVDGGKAREGTVQLVYPELDKGRVVADVVVEGIGDFFVGERTRVWVIADQRMAIVVPEEYVTYHFGLAYVRLKGGGQVVVQPGQVREDGVEILSGLRQGDILVQP